MAAGLLVALTAWFFGGSALHQGAGVLVFLVAALAWGAAWELGPGPAKWRLPWAFLASTLAAGPVAAAIATLPGVLVTFPCGAVAVVLLCLCCGTDGKRRRFSFVDALLGAAAIAFSAGAAGGALSRDILSGRIALEPKIALAAVSGGSALAAWGSTLYVVRGLELGLPLGVEHALAAAACFTTAARLHDSGIGVLVVFLCAAPALLLAISVGLRRLGRSRADAVMEGDGE